MAEPRVPNRCIRAQAKASASSPSRREALTSYGIPAGPVITNRCCPTRARNAAMASADAPERLRHPTHRGMALRRRRQEPISREGVVIEGANWLWPSWWFGGGRRWAFRTHLAAAWTSRTFGITLATLSLLQAVYRWHGTRWLCSVTAGVFIGLLALVAGSRLRPGPPSSGRLLRAGQLGRHHRLFPTPVLAMDSSPGTAVGIAQGLGDGYLASFSLGYS